MSEREIGFALREGGDGAPYLEESLVVPYGQQITGTPEYGSATEEFELGAFRDHRTGVVLDVHSGVPVSGRLPTREDASGFYVGPGPLLNTDRAREFATLVREGVIGPSVEFAPGEVRRTRSGVSHTRVAGFAGVAGTYRAAYSGAFAVRHMEGQRVTDIRDTEPEPTPVPVPDPKPAPAPEPVTRAQMAEIATAITADAIRKVNFNVATNGNGDPFEAWRGLTLGQMAQRAMNTKSERTEWGTPVAGSAAAFPQLAMRALDDLVTTAGANAGAITPGVFGEVQGIVNLGRPSITAFGGARQIPDASGMTLDWPYFDGTLTDFVGAQSAEKAAITSGTLDIKKGSEALATYAGGADISYQLLRRAQSSYIEMWTRVMLAAWALVTNTAFVTELESGSVTSDFAEALSAVDATEFKNLLIDASVAVQVATGRPAEFVLASTTAYKQFAKLFTPVTTLFNTGLGTTNIRTLEVAVGNLPLIHEPALTAGKLIVSNQLAAAWFEDGPFIAQAEDVEKLGKNIALWSMGAGARFIPAGIIEMYDVTP